MVPESRVVYVDHDPLVLAHASALLTSAPEGATDYIHADLREPESILRAASETLDLARPVAVMLLGVLNFIEDDDEVRRILRELTDAVVPGSYLVVSHPTDAIDPERAYEVVRAWNERGATPKLTVRSPDSITALFHGWDLLDPGMVSCSQWRPGHAVVADPVHEYACVAVQPEPPE